MAGSGVGSDFGYAVAVADPVEVGAPEILVDTGECPAACGDFSDERVVIGFGVGAATRGGIDGLEASGGEGFVEGDGRRVAGGELGDSGGGGGGVFGLHKDERHGGLGPVGFDECGKGAVVTAEQGVGGEGLFEVVEEGCEGGRPGVGGNWFPMEAAHKEAEGADTGFEVGNKAGVEVE